MWQTGSGDPVERYPFTDLAPTASAYIGRHSDQRPHASGCGTLLESAIERGEQVETSSLCDSIDDEATRELRDRGAYCLSC